MFLTWTNSYRVSQYAATEITYRMSRAARTVRERASLRDTLPPARCSARNGEVFFGLVVIAQAKHPVPSRTRPLSAVAPMVLRLKTWESRSPPNLKRPPQNVSLNTIPMASERRKATGQKSVAGWSSPVARQAHNLKVAGSNPAPATKYSTPEQPVRSAYARHWRLSPPQVHNLMVVGSKSNARKLVMG